MSKFLVTEGAEVLLLEARVVVHLIAPNICNVGSITYLNRKLYIQRGWGKPSTLGARHATSVPSVGNAGLTVCVLQNYHWRRTRCAKILKPQKQNAKWQPHNRRLMARPRGHHGFCEVLERQESTLVQRLLSAAHVPPSDTVEEQRWSRQGTFLGIRVIGRIDEAQKVAKQ